MKRWALRRGRYALRLAHRRLATACSPISAGCEGGVPMYGKSGLTMCGVVAALAALQISASAHHAFSAEFDAQKRVNLKGTVSRVEWINPHSWIHINIKKPNGTTEEWMIEGGTPN